MHSAPKLSFNSLRCISCFAMIDTISSTVIFSYLTYKYLLKIRQLLVGD